MTSGIIVSFLIFVILGLLTYFASLYTVKSNSSDLLIGIYILFLTLAQFFAAKIAIFDFIIFTVDFVPVGVIVFPFTLQLTDMVNERFGRKEVYKMIQIAFVSQILLVALLLTANIPIVAFGDDPLLSFAIVPSITIASWISFLISENFDAWIYDMFKQYLKEKFGDQWWKGLWIRNVVSDILSLGLDTIIFIPMAFFILPNLLSIFDPTILNSVWSFDLILAGIFGQLTMKWLLGVIDTPFMYLTRYIYEKSD